MNNTVILHGRLTGDPVLRFTKSQKSVASFQIAVNRDFSDGTDFFRCVAWSDLGETMKKYLAKGSEILVSGSLRNNNYTDNNGNEREGVEIVVNTFDFCGAKRHSSPGAPSDVDPLTPSAFEELEDNESSSDLPF